jgi:F0F1-type ATP synthase epsilon subunit
MKLSIYSLKNILFQGQATGLNCNTEAGEITVLDNHESLISVLAKGVMKVFIKGEDDKYFEIKSGFIEVKPNNEVRCIIDQ